MTFTKVELDAFGLCTRVTIADSTRHTVAVGDHVPTFATERRLERDTLELNRERVFKSVKIRFEMLVGGGGEYSWADSVRTVFLSA